MFHRIVHLDLKGAPWQVSYLAKIIPLIKKWGATGVLLEWEDTFPYTGDLIAIGSLGGSSREGLYTQDEVFYIMQCIKEHGMEPIQLVQTIGHMEFVLKHGQYRRLRELPRSPAVLCPSRADSRALCKDMVRQLLDAQPDANFIHIGADEAWHMNICSECQQKAQSDEHKEASLFLDHIKAIASFIKYKYPRVNVLMWDDMLRPISGKTLKAYNLGGLVQPVIWNYSRQLHIAPSLWERYHAVFTTLWLASAYKGADGSARITCDVSRYADNQIAWLEERSIYEEEISFGGVILTGWSRYDHYATLCELLPVALPSLASCLKLWIKPEDMPNVQVISSSLPMDEWPGADAALAVTEFGALRDRCKLLLDSEQIETWLNEWQVEHEYTSPLQAEAIAAAAQQLQQQLTVSRDTISSTLSRYCGRRSCAELTSRVAATLTRVTSLAHTAAARALAPAADTPRTEKSKPCD